MGDFYKHIIGGSIGFLVGIFGNLIAAWIQVDWMRSSFTSWGLLIIFILTALGLMLSAVYHAYNQQNNKHQNIPSVTLYKSKFLGSKLKTRGRGIDISRLFSLNSQIDIRVDSNEPDHED